MGQDFGKRSSKKPSITKTPTGDTGKAPRVEWRGFVQYEPTDNDRAYLDKLMSGGVDPIDELDKVVLEGIYDVKVSWDSRNSCYKASLYGAKFGHRHAGYTLAARAGSSYAALRRVLFIHTYVLEGEWNVSGDGGGWSDDRW